MTDWRNHETLAASLIAEIAADMPQEMRPGDVTIAMLADALGITVHAAEYQLGKLEREGRLTSVKVRWPGKRIAIRVWRRP